MIHRGNFSSTLQSIKICHAYSSIVLIQIPTNLINQHQIPDSYSKSRSTNLCVRLCNCVIGHDMLPFKNFSFSSFWKGWNKSSDCLWPSKGKWNKNSWVGQEGDESCYSQLIRKGQRSGLHKLGQLSGSKAIASVLDSYPNPLKWALILENTGPKRSHQKTGNILLEILYKSWKEVAFDKMFSGKCQSFIWKYGLLSENLEGFSRRIIAAQSKLI